MNVKIDTKEKFTVITPNDEHLSANMTEEMNDLLHPYLQKDIPHIVLNMNGVKTIDAGAGIFLAQVQQEFYENNASFVICGLNTEIQSILDNMELLEVMNITPTESEAWDMVQMEEIERELLSGSFDDQ